MKELEDDEKTVVEKEVIRLKAAGESRDQIARKTGLSEGSVSRILRKARQRFGDDVMDGMETHGRTYRKAKGGKLSTGTTELTDALCIVELSAENGLTSKQVYDYAKQSIEISKAHGTKLEDLISAQATLVAEATSQGEPFPEFLNETNEKFKQLAVTNKELSENTQTLSELHEYKKIKQGLAEHGLHSICEDPAKMKNLMANIQENDSDFRKVVEMAGRIDSIKAEHDKVDENFKVAKQGLADVESRMETAQKAHEQYQEEIEEVKSVHLLGHDKEDVIDTCQIIKTGGIKDPKLFKEQIREAGGLTAVHEKLKSELEQMDKEKLEKAAHLQALSLKIREAKGYHEFKLSETRSLFYQEELRPFTEMLAGVGNWTFGQLTDSAIFCLEGTLKLLPERATCRKNLEVAVYAIKRDFTVRDLNLLDGL